MIYRQYATAAFAQGCIAFTMRNASLRVPEYVLGANHHDNEYKTERNIYLAGFALTLVEVERVVNVKDGKESG